MQKRKIKTLIKSFFLIAIFAISFQALAVWFDSHNLFPNEPKEPINVGSLNQNKPGSLTVNGFLSQGNTLFDLSGSGPGYSLILNIKPELNESGSDLYLLCCKSSLLGQNNITGLAYWGYPEDTSDGGGGDSGVSTIWQNNTSENKVDLVSPLDKQLYLNSNLIYRNNNNKFIVMHSTGGGDSIPSTFYLGGAGPNINFESEIIGPKESVAIGFQSLLNNKDTSNSYGEKNTAVGYRALRGVDSGNSKSVSNSAIGYESMLNSTTGSSNSAFGHESLKLNTTGSKNTAIGYRALYNNTTGNNNTAIGHSAGPTTSGLSNTTAIGYGAQVSSSNHIRFGNDAVSYIGGSVEWSAYSDARVKKEIKDTDLGLDFVMQLKPVSYKYNNQENDKLNYGFIAQDLEGILKENTNIISKDGSKDNYMSLRHADLLAPLARAIQEQQETLEKDNLDFKNFKEDLEKLKENFNN